MDGSNYNKARMAVTAVDRPTRPGGVSDTKAHLANRIESLDDAVRGLAQSLQGAGFLRTLPPSATDAQVSTPKPLSMDSELSQHLSDLAARVTSATNRIEELTQSIDA